MNIVVSLCFFFSGLSGLCFEIIWTRQLERLVGTSSLAVSSVVASYMMGLALGSFITGRLQDRIKRPLLGYALCEASIALFGLIVPVLVGLYPGLYQWLWGAWYGESFYLFSLFRFVLVLATLLVPTTLMGATLPLLVKFFTQDRGDASSAKTSRRTSRLYTINLAGACTGTLFAGFWFLPSYGLRATTMIAVCINLTLPLLLLVGSKIFVKDEAKEELDAILSREEESLKSRPEAAFVPLTPKQKSLVRYLFALSGVLSMSYQMFWTRSLAIVLGASVYAFTLILSCFLLGLFVGGVIGTWALPRLRRPLMALGVVHLLVALFAYITALYLDQLPRVFIGLLTLAPEDLWQAMTAGMMVSALVLLLPATCLGALFPIHLRLLSSEREEDAARDIGSAYAANTAGSILGSFAGGYLFLPFFGLEDSLYGGVFSSAMLGALCFFLLRPEELLPQKKYMLSLVSLLVFGAMVYAAPSWDMGRLHEGLFRPTVAKTALGEGDFVAPDKILFYKDGVSTSVSLEELGGILALKVNGKVDASSGSDMPTQILAGSIPLLLHSELTQRDLKVAIIGYGSGVTVGSALQFPVERVDTIEIEPIIVEAAQYFSEFNHSAHLNPKLKLYYDDGRNFLQATPTVYDVIISEPSNPWLAGVASLFTEEFFQSVQARLAPNGVFLQWLQLYEISPETLRLVLRTFHKYFPEGVVFCAGPYSPDLLLVAMPKGQRLSVAQLESLWRRPEIAAEFARAKIGSPSDLLSLLMLGGDDLGEWVGEGVVNNDDNGALEFSAPRDLLLSGSSGIFFTSFYDELFEAQEERSYLEPWIGWSKEPLRRAEYARFAESLARIGRLRAALRYADRAEGLVVGVSTLEKPLGPARPSVFNGGSWFRASAWARVMVTFFYYRDQEAVLVPVSIGAKQDLEELQKRLQAAQREMLLLPASATLEERQSLWHDSMDELLRLEREERIALTAETEMLRGILAYKVGAFFPSSEALRRALEKDLSLRRKYPELSYYWAKSLFALSEYREAQREIAWYLASGESDFAHNLRAVLLPSP